MFTGTPIYQVGSDLVFGLRRDSIVPDDTDVTVEVTQTWENRLDLLSFELYGTTALWWIIADLNNMTDPMFQAPAGTQLRVPQKDRVFGLLAR